MSSTRLRELVEGCRTGSQTSADPTGRREEFAADRPYRLGQNRKRYAPPRVAAADDAREAHGPPTVIVPPPTPTEGIDAARATPGTDDGEAAPDTADGAPFHDEAVDQHLVLASPPAAANPGDATATHAPRDRAAAEGTGIPAPPDAAPSGLVQDPPAGPTLSPSQVERRRVIASRDAVRSDPRSAGIRLPASLSVESWKRKNPYSRLVLNGTGVSAALRDVEKAFAGTGLGDNLVEEVDDAVHDVSSGQTVGSRLDAGYARLAASLSGARRSVEATLDNRGTRLPAGDRRRIEAMIADLSTLEGRLEDRRALVTEPATGDVVAARREKLKILPILAMESTTFQSRFGKVETLLAGCDTMRGVSRAFGDNNPYRSLCNIRNLLGKIRAHHPEVADAAGIDRYDKELEQGFLWQAGIAPQAEALRGMLAASRPDYERERNRINESRNRRLREIDAEPATPQGSGTEGLAVTRDAEARKTAIREEAATRLEELENGVRIRDCPEIETLVDNAKRELGERKEATGAMLSRLLGLLETAA